MAVGFVRPHTSQLMLHVYERSVHPELIRSFAEFELGGQDYSASIQICDAGHAVTFRYDGRTLTEIIASREQTLPQQRRLLEKPVRGGRDETLHCGGGLEYSVSYQLEKLQAQHFLNIHEELLSDSRRAAIAYRFPSESRLAPEPISLVRAEATNDGLLVHAFHTFPGNCTVLKTQSLFELS